MKKNGFTLVELLAVVSILSLLLLLVAPKIVNQLNNSKNDVNDATKKIIYNAAENFIKDFNIEIEDYEIKCIPVEELQDEKYLSNSVTDNESGVDIKENKSVKVTYDEDLGYNFELVSKKVCNEEQGMLSKGLTPVAYDGDNWYVVSSTNKNNEWYDYDNQKWANAVVLGDVTKQVGDTVAVDGTEAKMMLVWIPRYEYKIEGNFGKGGQIANLPGEIEVNFIGKNKTTPTEGYHINDAFNFDGEKNGFWVGKFELSHETLSSNATTNNLGCSSTSCTNASGLRILPNVSSLRYNNVSNFWYGIKSIENTNLFGLSNMDTHMMKNSEWGAVAYLSQSKYGKYGNNNYDNKYKEVYQNKSSSYITGSSNGTPSQNTTNTQCAYNDMQDLGEDTNGYKRGQCGPGASTTGNIYGVYDMSGGSWEYVMGVYGPEYPTIGSSGFGSTVFTGNTIESKYYDIYANSTNSSSNDGSLSCNNGICYGHAMSETASWYGDYTYMVSSSYPWFLRGGDCYYGATAGVFGRLSLLGSSGIYSARVVGFGK